MSKNLPGPSASEEVDLGQLFNLIGNAFNRLFAFIASIFKAIFSVIVYSLKALLVNFKILLFTMAIAAVLGYVIQKTQRNIYTSQMLVRPYFDSKYQLVTNIKYYNALINENDYEQLMEVFNIDEIAAKEIISFDIHSGPENKNDKIVQYNDFIKSLDSTNAINITFEQFIENRSIYSGDMFEIEVFSYKKDIFRSLEAGLNNTFTNTYSVKKMQKRDSLLSIERKRILASIKQVDSLQKVYINVMGEEANKSQGAFSTKDGMTFIQERTKTREFDLLQESIKLKQALSKIDSQKVEEDTYFDTLSSFQDTGAKYTTISKIYVFILPIVAFVLLCAIFLMRKLIVFISKYEE